MNRVTEELNKVTKLEWACRILLTLALVRITSGYIIFIQTDYQLTSPVIPTSTIYEIARPFMIASLLCCIVFLIALWLYFFKRRTGAVVSAAICILGYEIIYTFFIR